MAGLLRCQLWLLIVASSVSAADLSLPLDGYYRTGKYFPVRFSASAQDIRISAEGAIATVIASPTGGTAPFLPIRSPLQAAPFSQPLRELRADEKLVGFAIDAPGVAETIFPGMKIISVRLDPTNPLPGAPMAWETLDGLVLSGSQLASLEASDSIEAVLANGTAIMASGPKPDAKWPWRSVNGLWVLQPPAAVVAVATDNVSDVLDGSFAGRPAGFRRLVFVLAAIFAILIVGASIWKSVWSVAISVVLAGAAIAIALLLGSRRMEEGGATSEVVLHGSPTAVDLWSFHYSMTEHLGFESFDNGTLPIFPVHDGPADAELNCDPDGTPREFRYDFLAGHVAAFVSRRLDIPQSAQPPSASISSPLLKMSSTVYPGWTPTGVLPGSADYGPASWPSRLPGLILESSDAIPK